MDPTSVSGDVEQLLAVAGAILLVAAGLGDRFGDVQRQIVDWLKGAFQVPDGKCGLLNLGMGILLGSLVGGYAAWQLDRSALLPLGILSGLFSSASASTQHHAQMRTQSAGSAAGALSTPPVAGDPPAPASSEKSGVESPVGPVMMPPATEPGHPVTELREPAARAG